MNDLVVVANRGPATLTYADSGEVVVRHAAGGLAPSLGRALAGSNGVWIAAAMTEAEQDIARSGEPRSLESGIDLHLVDLPDEVRSAAYRVIANGTLWFTYHGMFDRVYRPVFDRHWHEAWEGYRAYNRAFAELVANEASPGATVVVNDYHLALVGSHLRAERPDLVTVHFSHTPFCDPSELAVLPSAVATELMSGLASYGACGFHTDRWAASFRACATAVLGEAPSTFVAPLGIDVAEIQGVAASPRCISLGDELEERLAGRRLIVRSDRVELSKNLVRGFLAYEELLVTRPQWRDRVVFVARAYPSRTELPEYLAYRSEVERVVARVNERFGDLAHPPIVLEVEDDFEATVAANCHYDLLLVNPIRDGMNLVAKEGPAVNRKSGVLALSREAGAFAELGGAAVPIEPFDISGTASAIEYSLEMGEGERADRATRLLSAVEGLAPAKWFEQLVGSARRPEDRSS